MTREQAIEIAQRCAKAKPPSYYSEPFQPHEWVIDAILAAAGPQNRCNLCGGLVDLTNAIAPTVRTGPGKPRAPRASP